jgi:hypothetical protein
LQVWSSHYHKNRAANSVQEAADTMNTYRVACIKAYRQEEQLEALKDQVLEDAMG